MLGALDVMYFSFIFISHPILKSSVKISVNQLMKHKRPKSESESFINKLRQIVLAIHTTKKIIDMIERKNTQVSINMMVIRPAETDKILYMYRLIGP